MPLSEYNLEQLSTLRMVREHLASLGDAKTRDLERRVDDYLVFRKDVEDFQTRHLSNLCTSKCFSSRVSACCNREGIMTFFADCVINALVASATQLDAMEEGLLRDADDDFRCVYLSPRGCLWTLKPIVCEMFLCPEAKRMLFSGHPGRRKEWDALCRKERHFTWPDHPALFDILEAEFMAAGHDSPLMYCHKSPGLIRVKERARGL